MKKRKANKKLGIIMLFICIATLVITDIIVRPFSKAEEEKQAKTTSSVFSGGNGTEDSPYVITTAEELQTLAEKVNTYSEDSENGGYYKNKYYILSNNIDFKGKEWTPIGTCDSLVLEDCTTKYSFQGNFNGNGYAIKNITYDITSLPKQRGTYGIFGMLWGDGENNASIYNLTIDNMNITFKGNGKSYWEISIGTMAGQLGKNSSIRNCIVKNSSIVVNPEDSNTLLEIGSSKKLSIGGLAGETASNASDDSSAWERFTITDDYGIENCFVDVDITSHDETIKVSDSEDQWPNDDNSSGTVYNRYGVGGILGTICFADKFPKNCVYTGTIAATKPFLGNLYGKGEFVWLGRVNYPRVFAADGSKGTEGDTNYYYNYKVVNSELTPSEYSFNGEYENSVTVNGIEVHPITSTTTLMAYVQGVNRGKYTSSLANVVTDETLNSLYKNNSKYLEMIYDEENDTIKFNDKPEVLIQGSDYKYNAVIKKIAGYDSATLTYKWYIDGIEQENVTSNIEIKKSLLDRRLRVDVYSNEEKICTNTIIVKKEEIKMTLSAGEGTENTVLTVNIQTNTGDTVDDFTYSWYYKLYESDEYKQIENQYNYTYNFSGMPEGTYIKVVAKAINYKDFTIEAEYRNSNIVYVDSTNGNDSNNGNTPATAFKTLSKAYSALPDDKTENGNIIVIIGTYNTWFSSEQLASKSNVFTKPATICGKYLDNDYNGSLNLQNHTYLHANTILRDITLTTVSDTFLYTQQNDITLEESVTFGSGFGLSWGVANAWGVVDVENWSQLKRITIIGGTRNYKSSLYGDVKQRICNITIRCKGVAVVAGGARTTGDPDADVYGTAENPANVNITIDVKNSNNNVDVGMVVGGQCDSSSFINSKININNGKVARVIGGTLGYGNEMNGVPQDTFYGSTVINLNGGEVNEIYCGPLGRNDKTSYMYGSVELNINGGTINGNVYGSGAGGTFGYSEKYIDKMTDDFKNDETYGPKGKIVKRLLEDGTKEDISIENSIVNINISNGTVNGNIYGGGYGESAYLTAEQIADDGGTLYGDVNINITGGTINGDVYGGGRGSSKYGDAKQEIAQIYGNVTVKISDNAKITGNVFGGSEGIEAYPNIGKITGSISLSIDGENVEIDGSNIMGSGNAGDIKGTVKVEIKNANLTSNIFGGGLGKTAIVNPPDDDNKSIYVSINNSKITGNVYGGGDSGNVYGNIALYIGNKSNITGSVYGGGNNADIGDENTTANTYVYVIDATIGNVQDLKDSETGGEVFGGGNYGVVYGNTNIEVGSKDNQIKTIVENQMYAGGRGQTGVTTVTGDSSGQIIGTNTTVTQYGSSSLGKVAGNVNITFDTYKTTNNTDKYKVMAGINKATNLYLVDSYVYLTSGLTNIENLYIPKKSGMLISEDSTVEGNFTGGGELYLQNRVTLTIQKDITADSEQTTLTLNPEMVVDKGYFEIAGGEDEPYIVVLGTDYMANKTDESGNAIIGMVSGNKRKYEILNKNDVDYIVGDTTQKASIYYIEDTIKIPGYATEKISNKEGRIFTSSITNSDDVYILDNGSFSSQISVDYNMIRQKDESGSWKLINDTEMKNLRRYLYITGKDEAMKVPAGTVITMIVNNNYYTYKVPENYGTEEFWKNISADSNYLDLGESTVENLGNEIPVCLFTDSEGKQFVEQKNIQEKMNVNEDTTDNICTVPETYRFIIDFSNCLNLSDDEIQEIQGTHEVVFDIWDYKVDSKNNIIQEETFKDKKFSNDVHIECRKYAVEYNNVNVSLTGNITSNITFSANEISELNTNDVGKKIVLKITLGTTDTHEVVKLPDGTSVKINGVECNVKNNEILYTIINSMTTKSYNEKFDLQIDMSSVENVKKLTGTYYIKSEVYTGVNENEADILLDNPVVTCEKQIELANSENFGIFVSVNKPLINDIPAQIVTDTEATTRTINVTYQKGNLSDDVYIQAKTYKKNSDGKYIEQTKNLVSNAVITELKKSSELQDKNGQYKSETIESNIVFQKGLEKGTYRIEYSICYSDGEKIISDFINFIVK